MHSSQQERVAAAAAGGYLGKPLELPAAVPGLCGESLSHDPCSSVPRIHGILPTFRRTELLIDTLSRLASQSRRLDSILVIDNEGSAATRDAVLAWCAQHPELRVRFHAAAENLGSAGGWAVGMQQVLEFADDQDWIATLDDDDPPATDDTYEQLLKFATAQRADDERLAAVGIVGARFNWFSGELVRLPDRALHGAVDVDYVGSGHGAMYSAAVLRRMGVFRGDLFFGHTEIEYCLRLRRAGYRVLAHGEMWHAQRMRTGRVGIAPRPERICSIRWQKYYVTRNYIRMMLHFRRPDLALKRAVMQSLVKPAYTLLRSPRLALRGCRLGLRASWDGFRGRMGRTIDPSNFDY